MQPAVPTCAYRTDFEFMQAHAPTLKYDTFITLWGHKYIRQLLPETQIQFIKEIVASIFSDPKRIDCYGEDLKKFSWHTNVNRVIRAQYAKTPTPELIRPLASKGVCFLEPSELNMEDILTYDDFKNRYGFEYFKDLHPHIKTRFTREIAEFIFKNPQYVERYGLELRHAVICDELKAELLARYSQTPPFLIFQRAILLFQWHIFCPEDKISPSGSFKECFEQLITDYPTLVLFARAYGRGFYTSGFVSGAHAAKILEQHFKLNPVSAVSASAEEKLILDLHKL